MDPTKVVFAVSPREEHVDVLLGVSADAWEYMKDGRTHTFDLTKLGLPLRLILYGGPDPETLKAAIEAHNAGLGMPTVDMTAEDFGIGDRP